MKHHLQVPFRLLKDVPDLACGDPGTGNLILQADNLVGLKALPRERVPNSPLLGVCRGVGIYLLHNGILGDKISPKEYQKEMACAGTANVGTGRIRRARDQIENHPQIAMPSKEPDFITQCPRCPESAGLTRGMNVC